MSLHMEDLQAIIFDMDGVLFLSSDCHARAYAETLAPYNIPDFSYETVAGMRTDAGLRKIFDAAGISVSDEELRALIDEKQRRARGYLSTEGKIAAGSDELLAALAQKYRLALASSASRRTIDIYLSKSTQSEAWEFTLDGSLVAEAKPDPEIYLTSLKKLNLAPENCIVIEDSYSGIEAAVAAGIPVVAVSWGNAREPYLATGANMVVSEVSDLYEILCS